MIYIYRSVKKHNKVKKYTNTLLVWLIFFVSSECFLAPTFPAKKEKRRKEPKKLAAKKNFNFSILMFEN